MSVGIIVSCMPSLACFVRHYFPKFSVIDTLTSLRAKLLATRSAPNGAPSASSSYNQMVQDANLEEHDEKSKKSGASFNTQYAEMGNVAQITTRADGVAIIEMNRLDGIRVQHAWEQTSQSKDWGSKV